MKIVTILLQTMIQTDTNRDTNHDTNRESLLLFLHYDFEFVLKFLQKQIKRDFQVL